MKAIPVAPAKLAPQLLDTAYDEVAKAFADGQLVCIFPEGQLTKDGEIGKFRSGVSRSFGCAASRDETSGTQRRWTMALRKCT